MRVRKSVNTLKKSTCFLRVSKNSRSCLAYREEGVSMSRLFDSIFKYVLFRGLFLVGWSGSAVCVFGQSQETNSILDTPSPINCRNQRSRRTQVSVFYLSMFCLCTSSLDLVNRGPYDLIMFYILLSLSLKLSKDSHNPTIVSWPTCSYLWHL